MMLKTHTCTLALALFTMTVLTPGNALLRGSAPVAGISSAKAKAATGNSTALAKAEKYQVEYTLGLLLAAECG